MKVKVQLSIRDNTTVRVSTRNLIKATVGATLKNTAEVSGNRVVRFPLNLGDN